MPVNNVQHIVLVDISADTLNLIQQKLLDGFVITHIVNLAPVFSKLLIIYGTPENI